MPLVSGIQKWENFGEIKRTESRPTHMPKIPDMHQNGAHRNVWNLNARGSAVHPHRRNFAKLATEGSMNEVGQMVQFLFGATEIVGWCDGRTKRAFTYRAL
jgi:hypothetical protein